MRTHRIAGALLLGVGGALAQAPGLERSYRWLPAPGPGTVAATGDVNGDGRTDVVLGPYRSTVDVWLGGGDAMFQRLRQGAPYIQELARVLVLADFDGDGDPDLAMADEVPAYGSSTGMLRVLRNDGTGRFAAIAAGIPLFAPTALLAAGDLDADGDLDLVVGPGRQVWSNDGTGVFQPSAISLTNPAASDWTNAVTLADLDGDGDIDVYVSNRFQGGWTPTSPPVSQDRVFRNDGQGVFLEVAAPVVVLGNATLDTRAYDFDGDGDLDLVQLTNPGPSQYAWRLLRNDGALVFTQVWWQSLPAGVRIEVADWNGDGHADVAVQTGANLLAFEQTGPLQFASASLPVAAAASPILLDVDQDLDTDYLALAPNNSEEHRLVRNVGGAWELAPLPPAIGALHGPFDLADVNGDGALDLVIGASGSVSGRILLGDGDGAFSPAPTGAFGQYAGYSGDIECADIDGDGDPDILAGAYQEPVVNPPTSRLFRNVNGTFVAVPFPSVYGHFARLRDLDGDGDLDAILVAYGTITVATNDGSGNFQVVPGSVPFNAYDPRFVHVADFDGDGDLDLLVEYGSWGAGTQLFRNVGNAMFQAQATGLPPGLECAADLDGDGDVDLLGGAVMYRNDGTGTFLAQPFPALAGFGAASFFDHVLPEDVDQDGRVDLVVAHSVAQWQGQAQAAILWNQGGLVFTAVPLADLPYLVFPGGFFDFDQDGDRDLMLYGEHPTFLRSTWRHLASRALPRIGSSLDLDVRGRASEPYVLGLGLLRTWLPVAGFGALQLDPAALQVAALGSFDGAGQATFSAVVPNAPALVGLALHWQALSGTAPHLGNLLTTQLQSR